MQPLPQLIHRDCWQTVLLTRVAILPRTGKNSILSTGLAEVQLTFEIKLNTLRGDEDRILSDEFESKSCQELFDKQHIPNVFTLEVATTFKPGPRFDWQSFQECNQIQLSGTQMLHKILSKTPYLGLLINLNLKF